MRKLASSVAAALLLAASMAVPAAASDVACGDTITTNITLTHDLTCSGTGLVVGAPGITVDLGGFTLSGAGAGNGIDNNGGFDNVTITNGTIDGFANGVALSGADSNTISHLTITNNSNANNWWEGVGIVMWGGGINNTITHNTISGNSRQGVFLGHSGPGTTSYNTVSQNEISNNGLAGYDGYGIQLWNADYTIVSKNEISGHNNWWFGQGIYVLASKGNTIERNELEANSYGWVVWDWGVSGSANDNDFVRNEIEDSANCWWFVGTYEGTVLNRNECEV